MYNSGDAAEQVVRMSLEGAEFALKITGSAAKNLAAALYTVLKDQKKTKGKARIEAMLREKRPLKVYTIKKEDCPEFAKQAKGYGILYAPIPVKKGDDTIDILVFEDDAARANRIVEKFKLTVVDTASIKEDIEKSREQRGLFSSKVSGAGRVCNCLSNGFASVEIIAPCSAFAAGKQWRNTLDEIFQRNM